MKGRCPTSARSGDDWSWRLVISHPKGYRWQKRYSKMFATKKLPSSVNGWHKWASEIARTLSKQTFRACPWMSESMTLLSNGTLYKSNEMLRNSAEDLRILSTTEMRGRQLRPLITLDIQAASCFLLWNETETKANMTRANQAKANQAKCCRTQSGH